MLSKTLGGAVIVAALLMTAACAPSDADSASDATSSPSPSPSATQVLPPGADPDAGDGPQTGATLPTEEAALGESIAFDTGITVEIDSVEAIEVEAETPGEESGPAVVVTVTATNGSAEPQEVDSAVVTLTAADDELGIGTTAGSPSPLSGTVEPGQSATGRYVFMLDPAADRAVTVSVNYAAGEPVAVFTGKVS